MRPELEFVFRTLVELRVDVDDLRREFEAYRSENPTMGEVGEAVLGRLGGGRRQDDHLSAGGRRGLELGPYSRGGPAEEEASEEEEGADAPGRGETGGETPEDEDGASQPNGREVVYRPGMTIEEMERRAIEAALAEVDGNRRKAAELLGIGERTLYRKISKYDLED